MPIMEGLGKNITRMGSSRAGLVGTAAVAGTAGLVGSSTGSAVDALADVGLGDPNADQYFLGEKGLSPGTIIGSSLGPGVAAAGTAAGGAIGMATGGAVGLGVGSMLKNAKFANDVNIPTNFADDLPLIGGKKVPRIGGKNLFKGGVGGRGKIGMAIGGALLGGAIGATTYTRNYVNRNRDFFEQSPYNRGSAMQAASTNAYGDMVLGMHNSRRG